jgi:SAM-dependent methyltransferase
MRSSSGISPATGKWLDAACGSGYGAYLMCEYADAVYGIDRDPDAIAYAQEHYEPPVEEFERRDILAPCLDPLWGNFDVIISVETIEHLNQKGQAAWIRQVVEWLTPEGVFALTCPIRDGGGPNPKNPKHLWEPDENELLDMLGLYFSHATKIVHQVKMTSGEIQPNLYVRCQK